VVKRCQNIFYWVKKRLVWVVLDIEEIREKDNETGLKERGGIEMSIYSAFHIRDARSLSLNCILITLCVGCCQNNAYVLNGIDAVQNVFRQHATHHSSI